MIDDDSNELIPFEGGDSDADANTGNNNPDDTQSVTIIQDEQGIVFLGDAGTIDLWLKDEGFDSKAFTAKAVQTISSTSKGAQAAGNAMAESGRWIKLTKESAELVAKYGKNCKKGPFQAGVVRQPNGRIIKHLQFTHKAAQPRHAHRHQRRHGTDGTGTSRLRDHRLSEGNRCEARRPAARSERPDRQQAHRNLPI